jgi:hypothetical protein
MAFLLFPDFYFADWKATERFFENGTRISNPTQHPVAKRVVQWALKIPTGVSVGTDMGGGL